jgi:dTDP-glucose 4,6-dehydratase
MRLLVTGGAGFIGSNFVHYALHRHDDWQMVNLDKLTYAGNLTNLKDIEDNPRHRFVEGDIANWELVGTVLKEGFDLIINFAAETHVDRSILDSAPFVETNAKGTQVLLEGARKHGVGKLIHISTPEVYGGSSPLLEGEKFTEESPFLPNNPYSASKAAADLICRAYHRTYGLNVMLTRFANVFGPYQYPEKLLPLSITNALRDKAVPIYGRGQYRRNWIYVEDVCQAIDLIIQNGRPGEAYNIGSGYEMSNLELVYKILDILGKPRHLVTFVPDRPAHDWQYPLDSTKIMKELGWRLASDFEESLVGTIKWYRENRAWWEGLQVLDYTSYYRQIYKSK